MAVELGASSTLSRQQEMAFLQHRIVAQRARRDRQMPRVSIVVPAYNGVGTIGECLRSIRSSCFKDYELIVIDDGSDDDAPTVASEYADALIEHAENLGRHDARCDGIARCNGEFIINVDQDVVLPTDALERIVSYFDEHPSICAVT